MKKDNNHIDKLFNESLNQRSFDIPEAFLEDLNQRLDTSERKRRIFFWLFTGLLCMTGLSLVIFFSLHSPSLALTDSVKFAQPTNYRFSESYTAIHPEVRFGKTQLSITDSEMAFFDTMTEKSDPLSSPAIKTKKQTVEEHQQNEPATHKHIQPKISKNNVNDPIVPASNSDSPVPVSLNDLNKTADQSNSSVQSGESSEVLKNKSGEQLSDKNLQPIEDVNGSKMEKSDSAVVAEPKKDTTLVTNTADTSSLSSPGFEAPGDEGKKAPNEYWRTEIQLFGGLGANFINDCHTNKTYLEKIRENQSSILAPSFGIRGNISYKKFTFGTGLSYSQTGEKYTANVMNYTYKDSTYSEHVIDTILVFDDSLGIWVPEILDTTYYYTYQYKQDSVQERMSFKNRYSWISIPIYFGYRFELGKYELIPRIGAQFNFGIAKNRGNFPNADFDGILEYQAVKFNVSYLIQLEVRRNFNRWHIFINPYFKSMINPAISGDLIWRKYSSWGIQFGVGLKL